MRLVLYLTGWVLGCTAFGYLLGIGFTDNANAQAAFAVIGTGIGLACGSQM